MRHLFLTLAAACLTAALALSADVPNGTPGKVPLRSAGALAFGNDGVLFIGDSLGGSVVAVNTRDTKASAKASAVDIKGINEKAAALLGTSADQILINDVKVNPISKNIYLSVSRGKGPDAIPVILRIDAAGKLSEFSLDNVQFSSASLADAPASKPGPRGDPRNDAITEIAFVNGAVLVAGLSNQEFASDLRSIPYPFKGEASGAGIKMYHGSHGRYETQSPIRTFVAYTIGNQQFLLAAYTCTPLVKIPVSELKPGAKVEGTTIAELGAGNRPLDLIAYRKDNHDYLLLANSNRGVMKLDAANLEQYQPIVAHTEATGVPYTTLADFKGVKHLTRLDDSSALMLFDNAGSMDLRAVSLP
ncbi:MAG: hypothetical protein ABSF22_16985 [Bryobacteraceae bacterium]|jgi:hypothetical protein